MLTQDSSGLRADVESSMTNPGNLSIHVFQPASDLGEVITEIQDEWKPHATSDLPLHQDGNHGGFLLHVGKPGCQRLMGPVEQALVIFLVHLSQRLSGLIAGLLTDWCLSAVSGRSGIPGHSIDDVDKHQTQEPAERVQQEG